MMSLLNVSTWTLEDLSVAVLRDMKEMGDSALVHIQLGEKYCFTSNIIQI